MTVSTVPLPPLFYHAILSVLESRLDSARRRDIHDPVAERVGLSAEQRAERLPSGAHLRHRHRIGWAINMLKAAGYVESPSPGVWRITQRGRTLYQSHPQPFDDGTIKRITREARLATGNDAVTEAAPEPFESPRASEGQPPEERVDAAVSELRASLATELLERIGRASPTFFEQLVLDLLRALGYGSGDEDLEHVGGPGDGGVDGIVSLDRLGFEKIYVQAKRWQAPVGRPEVQAFFGALSGRRAKKGVIITTSTFTREAREFARQVAESLVLIDGSRSRH